MRTRPGLYPGRTVGRDRRDGRAPRVRHARCAGRANRPAAPAARTTCGRSASPCTAINRDIACSPRATLRKSTRPTPMTWARAGARAAGEMHNLELDNQAGLVKFELPIEHAANQARWSRASRFSTAHRTRPFANWSTFPNMKRTRHPTGWPVPITLAASALCRRRARFVATVLTACSDATAIRESKKSSTAPARPSRWASRHHALSRPVWGGVVAKSLVLDNLKPGKVAAGPAYVLGTTFLHGNQNELEEQPRDGGRDFWQRASRRDALSVLRGSVHRSNSRSAMTSISPFRRRTTKRRRKASSTATRWRRPGRKLAWSHCWE